MGQKYKSRSAQSVAIGTKLYKGIFGPCLVDDADVSGAHSIRSESVPIDAAQLHTLCYDSHDSSKDSKSAAIQVTGSDENVIMLTNLCGQTESSAHGRDSVGPMVYLPPQFVATRTDSYTVVIQQFSDDSLFQKANPLASRNLLSASVDSFSSDASSPPSFLHGSPLATVPVSVDLVDSEGAEIPVVDMPIPFQLKLPYRSDFHWDASEAPSMEPQCVYWDESIHEWSPQGCSLVGFDGSHFTCECDHMTTFAVRFETFSLPKRIFSVLNVEPFSDSSNYLIILVGVILSLFVALLVISLIMDTLGFRRLRNALSQDEEVTYLRRLYALAKRSFFLDCIFDTSASGTTPADSKACGDLKLSEYMNLPHGASTKDVVHQVFRATKGSLVYTTTALYSELVQLFDQYKVTHKVLRDSMPSPEGSTESQVLSRYFELAKECDGEETAESAIAAETKSSQESSTEAMDPQVEKINALIAMFRDPHTSFKAKVMHLWAMKFVLLRFLCIRMWHTHAWLSLVSSFDPYIPRSTRMIIFTQEFLGGLFLSAFFYHHFHGMEGQLLPAISLSDILELVVYVTVVQIPITLVISIFLTAGSMQRFQRRYPLLLEERRFRSLAEQYLSTFSTAELRKGLQSYGLCNLESVHEVAPEASDKSASEGDRASTENKETSTESKVPGDTDAIYQQEEETSSVSVDEYQKDPTPWIAPPTRLVERFPKWLMRFHRHPDQKESVLQSKSLNFPKSEYCEGGDEEGQAAAGVFDHAFLPKLLLAYSYRSKSRSGFSALRNILASSGDYERGLFVRGKGMINHQAIRRDAAHGVRLLRKKRNPMPLWKAMLHVYASPLTFIGLILAFGYICVSAAYLFKFAMVLSPADGKHYLGTWGFFIAQAIFLAEPIMVVGNFLLQLIIIPLTYPFPVFLPGAGEIVAKKTIPPTCSTGAQNLLTGRMELLTYFRAIGASVGISPASAMVRYGPMMSVASALSNLKSALFAEQSDMEVRQVQEKNELILKHYALAQLQIAALVQEED